jgi:hypothetical protein
VGRVWPQHGGCGRPLNSVVRSHGETSTLEKHDLALLTGGAHSRKLPDRRSERRPFDRKTKGRYQC